MLSEFLDFVFLALEAERFSRAARAGQEFELAEGEIALFEDGQEFLTDGAGCANHRDTGGTGRAHGKHLCEKGNMERAQRVLSQREEIIAGK